jgi:hypothetical protein
LLFVVCCFVVAVWWLPFGGCYLVAAVSSSHRVIHISLCQ